MNENLLQNNKSSEVSPVPPMKEEFLFYCIPFMKSRNLVFLEVELFGSGIQTDRKEISSNLVQPSLLCDWSVAGDLETLTLKMSM